MNPDILRQYHTLGLEPGASLAEIKAAYRERVQFYHPDKHSHNPKAQKFAERELKKINAAREALTQYVKHRGNSEQDSSTRQDAERQARERAAREAAERQEREAHEREERQARKRAERARKEAERQAREREERRAREREAKARQEAKREADLLSKYGNPEHYRQEWQVWEQEVESFAKDLWQSYTTRFSLSDDIFVCSQFLVAVVVIIVVFIFCFDL